MSLATKKMAEKYRKNKPRTPLTTGAVGQVEEEIVDLFNRDRTTTTRLLCCGPPLFMLAARLEIRRPPPPEARPGQEAEGEGERGEEGRGEAARDDGDAACARHHVRDGAHRPAAARGRERLRPVERGSSTGTVGAAGLARACAQGVERVCEERPLGRVEQVERVREVEEREGGEVAVPEDCAAGGGAARRRRGCGRVLRGARVRSSLYVRSRASSPKRSGVTLISPSRYVEQVWIWMPKDTLGFSELIIQDLKAAGVDASDVGATMDEKGTVEV